MVSTHLKNISQNGNLPQLGVKIKNIWNHNLVIHFTPQQLFVFGKDCWIYPWHRIPRFPLEPDPTFGVWLKVETCCACRMACMTGQRHHSVYGRKDSAIWWWQIVPGANGVHFMCDFFLGAFFFGSWWFRLAYLKISETRPIFSRLLYDWKFEQIGFITLHCTFGGCRCNLGRSMMVWNCQEATKQPNPIRKSCAIFSLEFRPWQVIQ